MWRRRLFLSLVTLLSISAFIQPALGKGYPTRPIELLCPYTPGGSFDLYSRLLSDRVAKHLGQPMVVINKPGGGEAQSLLISLAPNLTVTNLPYLPMFTFTQPLRLKKSHLIPVILFH